MLAAMWAMVRHWHEQGSPAPTSKLPTYQTWANVVAGIVEAAGFADPLQRAELTAGGDSSRTEFRTLLEAARAANQDKRSILLRLPDWAALARHQGLYHQVLGSIDEQRQHMEERRLFKQPLDADGNPRDYTEDDFLEQAARYLDKSASTKFAGIMHRKRAVKHKLSDGCVYQFGSRQSRRSAFELVLVETVEPTPEDVGQVDPF